MLKSPLAYFGNRSQDFDDLLMLLRAHREQRGHPYTCCYDLFAGSLSLTLPLLAETKFAQRYVINDINQGLIIFWQWVQADAAALSQAYESLLSDYLVCESQKAQQFYLEKQQQYNLALASGSKTIDQAAQFAWLTNHAKDGIPLFQGQGALQPFISPPEESPKRNAFDRIFAQCIEECAHWMRDKNIEFRSAKFTEFFDSITSDDFVLLDPPYPDMEDAQENENSHIYIRTEPKRELKRQLKRLLQKLEHQRTPFLMCYGVLGMENPHPIVWSQGHLLRIAGTPDSLFQEYVEHVYVSSDLAELFIQGNYQKTVKGKIQPLFHKLIEVHALTGPYKHGNHTAIVWGEEKYTYAQLNASANRLAHYLLKTIPATSELSRHNDNNNTAQETLIALYLDRGPQLIMSWLGVLKSGYSYLP